MGVGPGSTVMGTGINASFSPVLGAIGEGLGLSKPLLEPLVSPSWANEYTEPVIDADSDPSTSSCEITPVESVSS